MGSEMCIRDRDDDADDGEEGGAAEPEVIGRKAEEEGEGDAS